MRKWAQLAMGTSAAVACMGMAFGQDYSSPTTETSTSTYTSTTTTSSPSSSGPAAPRTGLFTSVTKGNAAADNTVDDYSRRPTLIGDRQYFAGYGGVELADAATSLRMGSLNWFSQVTANGGAVPSTLRVGAGTSGWGGGLLLAVNRTHTETAPPTTETTTYFEASGFGLFGDLSFGSSDLYGAVNYNTGDPLTAGQQNSVHTVAPAPTPEDDDKNRNLGLMVGWKKDATTEGTHAINVEATYLMVMVDTENPTVDATTTQVAILPAWGYIFKASSDYSVFLGLNGVEQYTIFEQGNSSLTAVTPNIALHKQLSQRFEGFAGFSVTGSFLMSNDTPVEGAGSSQILTGGADVAVGLRWVKDNFALEGSLKETVLANGPYLIGGNAGQGFFLAVGLSMGI